MPDTRKKKRKPAAKYNFRQAKRKGKNQYYGVVLRMVESNYGPDSAEAKAIRARRLKNK